MFRLVQNMVFKVPIQYHISAIPVEIIDSKTDARFKGMVQKINTFLLL